MIVVQYQGKVLSIDGVDKEMPYEIRDAFSLNGKVVVLIDPDSYLRDAAYSKERRRGENPFRNLIALSGKGELLWEAEFPDNVGYYYSVLTHTPLVANFSGSYRCEIDSETGQIVGREFYK